MTADAKTNGTHPAENTQPAKGGTKPANPQVHPSGDSPKPHGDPFRRVITDKKK